MGRNRKKKKQERPILTNTYENTSIPSQSGMSCIDNNTNHADDSQEANDKIKTIEQKVTHLQKVDIVSKYVGIVVGVGGILVATVFGIANYSLSSANYKLTMENEKYKAQRERDLKLYEKEVAVCLELCEIAAKVATSADYSSAQEQIRKWSEVYIGKLEFIQKPIVLASAFAFNDELKRQIQAKEFSNFELMEFASGLSRACKMSIDIEYHDKLDSYVKKAEFANRLVDKQINVTHTDAIKLAAEFDTNASAAVDKYLRKRGEQHSDPYLNVTGEVEKKLDNGDVVLRSSSTHRVAFRPRFPLPVTIGSSVASSGWARHYDEKAKILIIECEGVLPQIKR